MSKLLRIALSAAFGYGIGSIPFGLLLGKVTRGVDVREHGSHSIGTTNVLRTIGMKQAAATFALDVGKGSAAVGIARLLGAGPCGEIAAGLAAIGGHSWPLFAKFRGGKSVATAFGAVLLISPKAAGWAVVGGLGTLAVTRVVSVSSLAATGSAAVVGLSELREGRTVPAAFIIPAAALIVYRHRANLERLRQGTEPKVGL